MEIRVNILGKVAYKENESRKDAEKLERINSLRKNEVKVKGESMKDSLYDLANYAILTIMELEKTEK